MKRIAIAGIADGVTTARYFERAALAAGLEIDVLHSIPDPSQLAGTDCLIVVDPCLELPGLLRVAPCPVVGYLIDVHQQLPVRLAYARYFDHVFVAQPAYLAAFDALPHASAHWLPLACEPQTHYAQRQERIHDVGFVGKLGAPGSERRATLESVLARFSTNDCLRHHSPREMGEAYSRSRIVFNKSINGDLNMRFFEGLAAGALLVTDRIGNGMDRIGRDGEHYVTYSTVDEAIDKISYYLAHDAEREAIAARGQQLVFEQHTYAHRLAGMLDVAATSQIRPAPARHAPASLEAVWRSECFKLQGAPPRDIGRLVGEGNLSPAMMQNAAVALARGIVRPVRQAIARTRRAS